MYDIIIAPVKRILKLDDTIQLIAVLLIALVVFLLCYIGRARTRRNR